MNPIASTLTLDSLAEGILIFPYRKLAVHVFLALGLLAAQWVAQAHAFSHLRPPSHTDNGPAIQTQLCAECLAGAPLLAAASAPDITFALPTAVREHGVPIRTGSWVDRTHHSAFRSRAPPPLV